MELASLSVSSVTEVLHFISFVYIMNNRNKQQQHKNRREITIKSEKSFCIKKSKQNEDETIVMP